MNATLADWLDYDLAQVGLGGVSLSDFLAGDGASLLAAIAGGGGEDRTEQFDLDLKRRDGVSLPVRLIHRVAFGDDGAASPSRTLVLNRAARGEPADDLRSAEVRFARVFNSTPMAIAILDGGRTHRALECRFRPAHGGGLEAGGWRRWPLDLSGIWSATATRSSGIGRPPQGRRPIFRRSTSTLAGEGDRSARLFVSASDERDGTGATIYAVDTTEQRTLQDQFRAISENAGHRPARRRRRA